MNGGLLEKRIWCLFLDGVGVVGLLGRGAPVAEGPGEVVF